MLPYEVPPGDPAGAPAFTAYFCPDVAPEVYVIPPLVFEPMLRLYTELGFDPFGSTALRNSTYWALVVSVDAILKTCDTAPKPAGLEDGLPEFGALPTKL
jgi:hypothetical protein